VLSSLGVLGTGLALIAIGQRSTDETWFAVAGQSVSPLTLHQAFFVVFAIFVGLHLLARLIPAAVLVSGRTRPGSARTGVPGRAARFGAVGGSLIAAVAAVFLVVPTVSDWNHHVFDRDDLRHSRTAQ
jgi:hypothetical protein